MKPEIPSAGTAALLDYVVEALELIFKAADFEPVMPAVLASIGKATRASRIVIFEIRPLDRPDRMAEVSHEWIEEGVPVQPPPSAALESIRTAFSALLEQLSAGSPVQRQVRDGAEEVWRPLCTREALSFLAVPIKVGGELWGFFSVEDFHRERVWTADEVQAYTAVAAGLGGAIARREAELFLKEQAAELKRHRNVALSLIEDARLAEQEAARASESKSKFLAMMSHEIRTPLNGVIGFTDLLLAEGLADRQSEMAEAIRTCGQTLLILIRDILDISKIESDHLLLEDSDGDVFDCVRSVVATFEPAAAKAGITLSFEPEEFSPRWWRLDYPRLKQIIFNLVGNAVKFAPGGKVTVQLWITSDEELSRIHCRVSDSGRGISAEDLEVIFEPFLQGKGAREAVAGGSGLGLAICRRLVEAMGGKIEGTSTLGEGSCFTFDVLAKEASSRPLATEAVESADPLREGDRTLNILVVDDVEMNLRVATSLLARLGYSAQVAHGGPEALDKISEVPFDVIFMDVLMPGMDGLETARRVRDQPVADGAFRPWIVALTADAMAENRQRCLAAGMDDFLTKPLRLKDMESCLARRKAAGGGK